MIKVEIEDLERVEREKIELKPNSWAKDTSISYADGYYRASFGNVFSNDYILDKINEGNLFYLNDSDAPKKEESDIMESIAKVNRVANDILALRDIDDILSNLNKSEIKRILAYFVAKFREE